MPTVEERLRLLEDERQIERTLATYGHGLDYNLEAEWRDCWTNDALLVWPSRPPLRGIEMIMAEFRKHTHAPQAFHKHLVIEPRIAIAGDSATVDSMFARLDRYASGGPQIRAYGRYRDRLVRSKDGHWRFSERIAEVEAWRDEEILLEK